MRPARPQSRHVGPCHRPGSIRVRRHGTSLGSPLSGADGTVRAGAGRRRRRPDQGAGPQLSLAQVVARTVRAGFRGADCGAANPRSGAAAGGRWRGIGLGVAQARGSEPERRPGAGRHERAARAPGRPDDGEPSSGARIRAPSDAAACVRGGRAPRRSVHGRAPSGARWRPLGLGRTRRGRDRGRRSGGGAHVDLAAHGVRRPSGEGPRGHAVPQGPLTRERPKPFTERDPDAADLASRRRLPRAAVQLADRRSRRAPDRSPRSVGGRARRGRRVRRSRPPWRPGQVDRLRQGVGLSRRGPRGVSRDRQ